MQHETLAVAVGSFARVAVFVDGDNLPPSLAEPILAAAARLGRADLRRVYAADGACKSWDAAAGFRVSRAAGAKNGTDLLLCIEAVAAACDERFERVAIASDDRDFIHLAHWLRERGVHVLGLGTAKSPDAWRAACTEFEVLPDAQAPAVPSPPVSALDRVLKAAIGRAPNGQEMVRVGNAMSQAQQRPPDGTWRAYMATRPDLYDLDPRGPKARVRWIGP
jgi:hypothetical protein